MLMHRKIVLYICRSWLLGITEYGTVQLLSLSGPLDMPYSVELWCIGVFGGPVKLNTCWMMGPMTE